MHKTRSSSRFGRVFEGQSLTQIAMPMGGIGAGCICLNGIGGLHDFSIRNAPSRTALPDGWTQTDASFALLHLKSKKPLTLLLEGQMPRGWVYDRGLQGQGYRKGGEEGLPRFQKARFRGEYPFGHVDLSDGDVPLSVAITGWSPLIPLDDRNSSMPCAILEYSFKNTSRKSISFEFSYHISHWAKGTGGDAGTRTRLIPNGVALFNTDSTDAETFGSASLSIFGHKPLIKASWFRGGWFDAISVLWKECSEGKFQSTPPTTSNQNGRNGASVMVKATLRRGESINIPVVLTWHFPNVYYAHGQPKPATPIEPAKAPLWHPFYIAHWPDAAAVAEDLHTNFHLLRNRTEAFKDALYSSTLPAPAIDAVASNLAILKSPTILRQANGNLWAWEGCFTNKGCCHGSCTHVWNYAQALPHLFPQLERTLREQELERSMDDRGHVNFRSALPDGPNAHDYHAAADGQLGGIMKLWRDYHISGDRNWLAKMYPLAKRSIGFCIQQWDPERKGILSEPHHNTYDIEFWGPDGMCTSVYLGALSAMADLADVCDDFRFADECREIAQRGAALADKLLFNGSYYIQKVQWKNLQNRTVVDRLNSSDPADPEIELLRREGPKYQFGSGCISDGVIGAWMAELYGIHICLKREHVAKHLASVFKYNFKPSLIRHANCQRCGYAMGDESGLVLCTWPAGGKPTLPFPYADEIWTGIEYQVASHLLLHGKRDEAMQIIESVRNRYDGIVRNPFDEYECGSFYARALSSYSLLQAFSGIRYSAADRVLYAQRHASPIQTFLCTASGYGTVRVGPSAITVTMISGRLDIASVEIRKNGKSSRIEVNQIAEALTPTRISLGR